MQRLGIGFLIAESLGATAWWIMLIMFPSSRAPFMVSGAPDSTLMAFFIPDFLLFVGSAAAAAYGISRNRAWAWPILCVHAGAAGYAGLYCWSIVALTGGDGIIGALLMTPSMIVPGRLVITFKPLRGAC